jgi:branched-chain amino acid transport system substrate-binding protein
VIEGWAKSVNAAGGLNGHEVNIVVKDDNTNPATALTDAQALISSKVAVIIDEDIVDAAWAKVAADAKVPVVGGNITSTGYGVDPNFYPSGQTNDSVIYSSIATAKQAGAKKIAVIYCSESPTCAASLPGLKSAGKALGVPVVYSAGVSATAPNYTAQCLAAKQAGADALFIGDGTNTIDRIATNCTQQGYKPTYITEGAGFEPELLSTPGISENEWASFPVLPFFSKDPAVQAMNKVVDQYSPGLRSKKLGWGQAATLGWTAALLVQAAAKKAGFSASDAVTSADFVKGLNMISNETLGGFAPGLTFDAGKPHQVDCWFTAQVSHGTPKQVGGRTCHTGT